MTTDWRQKMLEGMRLMKEACDANGEWNKCEHCPFDEYCTALMEAEKIDPFAGLDWDLE